MVVPPQREGGQRAVRQSAGAARAAADTLQPVLEWAVENLEEDLSVAALSPDGR